MSRSGSLGELAGIAIGSCSTPGSRAACMEARYRHVMCVFRVSGGAFDVDAFLSSTTLDVDRQSVYRRGERRVRRRRHQGEFFDKSGFQVNVSDAEWDRLGSMVPEVVDFLEANGDELRRLVGFPGVDEAFLDFPLDLRIGEKVAAQFDYLPANLIRAAGSVGVGIMISLYPVSRDEEDA